MDPERLQGNPERNSERIGEAAQEQAERLRGRFEQAGENTPESQAEKVEKARAEASKEALMSKEAGKEHRQANENATPAIRRITRQQKDDEYKRTLSRVQSHLSTPSKTFSKVIHIPIIENTSELAGKTIARPNAILAGGICAFLLTGLTYLLARSFGYQLSGFETIGAFTLGFIIGILYDFLKTMITGKKS